MRTRQRERIHLQSKKRAADSAAATRKETALGDGLFKRQRQEAENHIAELICRFASFSHITGRYHFPKGKMKEVFDLHATKTYSDLNVGFERVRDRVYRLLSARKRDRQVEDKVTATEETIEEVRKYFYFTLFILVGLIKPCFVCASVLLTSIYSPHDRMLRLNLPTEDVLLDPQTNKRSYGNRSVTTQSPILPKASTRK